MTEHLLLVSIGPVQDFIAAGRRCQDLWFGSFLLSEMAGQLARGLFDQGATLIFPGLAEIPMTGNRPSVANKIAACLPASCPPGDAVRRGRAAMEGWLKTLRDLAFDRCSRVLQSPGDPENPFYRDVAEKQLEDLLEIQWVAVPLAPGGYAQAHAQAEQLLAFRKNTRDFGRVPWDGLRSLSVPKSSLDGQRESVIDERFFKEVRDKGQLGAQYRLGPSERLCGVGLLKRFGLEVVEEEGAAAEGPEKESALQLIARRPIFHSTSHVAAGPLLTYLSRRGQEGQDAFHEYITALKQIGVRLADLVVRSPDEDRARLALRSPDGADREGQAVVQPRAFPGCGLGSAERGLDGCLLYEDRLQSILEESSQIQGNDLPGKTAEAKAALRRLFHRLQVSQPPAYYAILAADGDRMGATIRSLAAGAQPIEQHQRLSAALASFAASARQIIEEDHAGSLIYSGGDDVLALLPLHTALACARALQLQFAEALAEVCAQPGSGPTLSVGLAVVHHLQHLGVSRALAQEAERLAKKQRNSLAILVDKRSGGTLRVTGRWDEAPAPLDERIARWCQLLGAGELPDGLAYELETLLVPFEVRAVQADGTPAPPPAALIASLVRRATTRKRKKGGLDLAQATQALLHQAIDGSADPIGSVRALSSELQIARGFLPAHQIAWR